MRGFKYQVEVLERRYTELEYKCKAQEATIERLSKNYYELKKWHDKATELIDVAARCMDDCDYAMTKVSNDRVEEAISVWNEAYNQFKGGTDDDRRGNH